MELLRAVVLIVILAVTPSVLFLLFWWGLQSLRNDALIDTLEFAHGLELRDGAFERRSITAPWNASEPTTEVSTCPSCGAKTIGTRRVCIHCGSHVPNSGSEYRR